MTGTGASLAGRSAWVIGASSGLGRAVAVALGELGASLTLSARRVDLLRATAKQAASAGASDTSIRPVDVRDRAALRRALEDSANDPPHVVVVGGGGPPPSTVMGLDPDQLDEAYELVLRPAAAVVAALAPPMAARGSGVLGFITSSAAREPIPGLVTSNVCRAGLTALAKSAATELGASGVRVLCFAPGRVDTERVAALDASRAQASRRDPTEVVAESTATIPLGRYGRPEEFGRVVAFHCSPAASYMTGVTVSIDGGKSKGLVS